MAVQILSDSCLSILTIGESQPVVISANVTLASNPVLYPPCCLECETPIVEATLYEGDCFISFSLNMPDGTLVNELTFGGWGTVFNGTGTIELDTPLTAGSVIQLQVNDSNCKALSCKVSVNSSNSDCTNCEKKPECHIRVVDIDIATSGNNGTINSLVLEKNSDLKYRLNGGAWIDDWRDLGFFALGESHTLGIKSVTNPNCRIVHTIITAIKIVYDCTNC